MPAPVDTSTSIPPPGFGAPATPAEAKSAATAVALTLLIPGAGHWYAGERGRGLAFLAAALLATLSVMLVVGIVALPAVCIWAAVDAAKGAERHNTALARV